LTLRESLHNIGAMKVSLLKTTVAILIFVFSTNTLTPWTRPVAAVNNNLPDAQTSVPSNWSKIDADGKFSFYLPPDMRVTGKGIENFHREYSNGRIHVSFDYEPYQHLAYANRALALGKDFQEIELQVDGKKSFLFVYQSKDMKNRPLHKADLYVGDLPNSDVILSMSVSSGSPQAVETAKAIYRTIKFPTS